MTYGPVKKNNKKDDNLQKFKNAINNTSRTFFSDCQAIVSNSRLGLNTILGIVLAILFAGCIGGYLILNTLKSNVSETSTRDDSQPTIIVNAESQNDNIIHINDVKSIVAEYDMDNILEGDYLDITKINVIVTYDDNRTIVARTGQFNISENAKNPLEAGNNVFYITYNSNKCVLNVIAQPNSALNDRISKYSDEFSNADVKYVSDTLWITGTKYAANDVYWLYHIICSKNNTPRMAMSRNESTKTETILQNEAKNGWTFAVNGSYYDKDYNPTTGLYMCDQEVYSNITTTSGNELCITTDGLLFTPEPGLSASDLISMNVIDTIVSDNPTLIKDGKITDIPTTYLDNINTKTIIAMKDKGEYYIIVAADGMYTNYNDYNTLTNILLNKHCTYAKAVSSASNVTAALNDRVIVNPPLENRSLIDVFAFYE